MRIPKRIKFTKEGLENVKTEQQKLLEERPEAVRTLKAARELGDLSENGLYHAAKARLRSMDSQIRRLSGMLKLAEVYEAPKDKIGIGSKVLIQQEGKQIDYQIVGDYEADPLNHKVSTNSPVGRALSGRKAGDEVQIYTPAGERILKIIKVL